MTTGSTSELNLKKKTEAKRHAIPSLAPNMPNQSFLKVATLFFILSRTLLLVWSMPFGAGAEGIACDWVGCRSDGSSQVYCISGAIKRCTGGTVCYDISEGEGNLYCGLPGADPNGLTPSSIVPVSNAAPPPTSSYAGVGWNDRQERRDGSVTYHPASGGTACGPEASDYFTKSPYYVAVSPVFFGGSLNPNNAPVCNQRIRLSCK